MLCRWARLVLLPCCLVHSARDAIDFALEPRGEARAVSEAPAARFSQGSYAFPAAFQPHSTIWLSIHDQHPWSNVSRLPSVAQIVDALHGHVNVSATAVDSAEIHTFKTLLSSKHISDSHVRYYTMNTPAQADPWLRDNGPIFLRGPAGDLKILKFRYTYYGEEEPTPGFISDVDAIPTVIATRLGIPVVHSMLSSEGGNREVDGQGTLMSILETEQRRNPGLSPAEIQQKLLSSLGQRKMIWLQHGIAQETKCTEGPIFDNLYSCCITGGHIDEMARFVGPGIMVIAYVSEAERYSHPLMSINYDILNSNLNVLSTQTDAEGNALRIIRMPLPDPVIAEYTPRSMSDYALRYFKGSRVGLPIHYVAAASYLNFIVTNGVVIVPQFWKPGRPESSLVKDRHAAGILQSVFPDRKIVPMHADAFTHNGGGLHCNTQQQPL